MDEVNAENARKMFGEEEGAMVYFSFYAEPSEPKSVTPEQAYDLHWRLVNFLRDQDFGFDGTVRLTTWKKERAREEKASNA